MSDLIKDALSKRIGFHRHQLALTGQEGTVLDKLLADCKAESSD